MVSNNSLLLPVAAGILSGVILILVISLFSNQLGLNYSVVNVLADLNVIKTEYVKTIANGEFIFRPGDEYQPFLFVVPNDATDARLGGAFEVRGTASGVVALIVPQKDYAKWQAGEPVSYYYNSGNVTSERFYETVPSGQAYYLIIDNSFSKTETKFVQLIVQLSYDQ